jgi:hypothetical protein
MNKVVRRKLEMAERVQAFSRAHPSADANYASVLGRLEERIARMEVLAAQQREGVLATHSSTVRRKVIRRRIHYELLRHLVRVAEVAAKAQPELTEKFVLPQANASNQAFRTAARTLLERGQAQRELLLQHGLAEKLLDDLAAAVGEYEAALDEALVGRQDHVGASAELEAVSNDVTEVVELLDGLNRYRFGRDAELMAAWQSARNVVGPSRESPGATTEVKPAA